MRLNKWKHIKVSPSKILFTIESATQEQREEGMGWYQEANKKALGIARMACASLERGAGVIAALSPAVGWERNLLEARAMMLGEQVSFTTYGPNVAKARAIAHGGDPLKILGGQKVRAFFHLIVDPTDPFTVCVDRHAVRVATINKWDGDKDQQQFLNTHYNRVARAYRKVGIQLGILPNQAQAIAWIVQRSR